VTENKFNRQFPKLHDGAVIRKEEFGFIVFDPLTDTVFKINLVGTKILQYCNGARNVHNISKLIAEEFDTDQETAFNDVNDFISELAKLNLIKYV